MGNQIGESMSITVQPVRVATSDPFSGSYLFGFSGIILYSEEIFILKVFEYMKGDGV